MECEQGICAEVLAASSGIAEINKRLEEGDKKLKDFSEMKDRFDVFLKEWAETKEQVAKTTEIVSAWENLKGFHTTLNFISGFLKVILFIGAFFAALFAFYKVGADPKDVIPIRGGK